MKRKEKIIGIILILTALVIGGIFLYRSLKKPPQEIVTVTEEKEQKITITEEEKVMMKTIVDSDHSEEVLILVLDFYPVSNQYNIHP